MSRDDILRTLKLNLTRAQNHMMSQADKHRSDRQYNVEDWVYVKLQPYRQHTVAQGNHPKLGRRYFGPFHILERIGPVAYRLALPSSAKIHSVFHVSQLKRYCGDPLAIEVPTSLPVYDSDTSPLPMAVLRYQRLRRQNIRVPQALVQWDGLPPEEASWVDIAVLHHRHPTMNLEDKVLFEGNGNDMNIREVAEEVDDTKMGCGNRTKKRTTTLNDYVEA